MQWVFYLGEMENTRIWLCLTICSLWIVLAISGIFKTIPSRPNSCLGQHHSLHQTWIRCFRLLDAKHKVLKFLSPSHALLHFLLHIVLVNLRICVWFPNRVLEILASSWGFFIVIVQHRPSPNWGYPETWIFTHCLTVDQLFWSMAWAGFIQRCCDECSTVARGFISHETTAANAKRFLWLWSEFTACSVCAFPFER